MIGGRPWEGAPMFDMRRREFITLIGGAAAAWPLTAQGAAANGADDRVLAQFVARWCRTLVAAFRQGLNITGFVGGQNASGISLPPRITQTADNIAAPAAKAATTSIPIVFAGVGQPPARRAASANAQIALRCGD